MRTREDILLEEAHRAMVGGPVVNPDGAETTADTTMADEIRNAVERAWNSGSVIVIDHVTNRKQEDACVAAIDRETEVILKLIDDRPTPAESSDAKSTGFFPLRELLGDCIELCICFPGGYFMMCGRVQRIDATPVLWVGKTCRFSVDALVRRESIGDGFVYDYKGQD